MTNLSANVHRPHKGETEPRQYGLVGYTNYQGGTTTYTVYKGAPMMLDVSDVDGYAQPMTSSITAASGDVFLGIAAEKKAIASTDAADGAKTILVENGLIGFPVASLAVTDIGAPAYMSDTNTVTTTSSNALWIGTIIDVDATYVWVDTRHAAGRTNTAT